MRMCPKKGRWVKWSGRRDSVCPPGLENKPVQIRCRDGSESTPGGMLGRHWSWDYDGSAGDIVAYRVVASLSSRIG